MILRSLSLLMILTPCFARATVKIKKSRTPAAESAADRLANKTFLDFLNCSRLAKLHDDTQALYICAAPYFAHSVPTYEVQRFLDVLLFPNEYSELQDCGEDFIKTILAFERKDYSLYRCFESNLLDPARSGVVFFKIEKGIPKILRFKM